MDKIKLKSNAHQKLSTINPSTMREVSKIIPALITNRNNPNETIVTGMVRIIMIGFITLFKNESTVATTKAVKNCCWLYALRATNKRKLKPQV